MTGIIASIEGEYRRYVALAEAAMAQLEEAQLAIAAGGTNSIATIAWHIAGNLESRFTDFLTSDGEKPWRDRESEFADRSPSREELLQEWSRGWSTLFAALETLTDDDLTRTVTIRGQPLRVHDALHRSLAHTCYHVGQIVHSARSLRGSAWEWLSIPPGGSAAYNRDPSLERPQGHASRLDSRS